MSFTRPRNYVVVEHSIIPEDRRRLRFGQGARHIVRVAAVGDNNNRGIGSAYNFDAAVALALDSLLNKLETTE